jgi:hypothetical protein
MQKRVKRLLVAVEMLPRRDGALTLRVEKLTVGVERFGLRLPLVAGVRRLRARRLERRAWTLWRVEIGGAELNHRIENNEETLLIFCCCLSFVVVVT